MTLARSAGRISSNAASRWVAPWLSSGTAKPSMSRQSTTCVWPLRPKRFEPSCSATLLISQSRVRVSSMPTSYTAPTTPVSLIVT